VEVSYIADVAHELAAWVKPILHKKYTPAGKLKQCLKNCNRGVLAWKCSVILAKCYDMFIFKTVASVSIRLPLTTSFT